MSKAKLAGQENYPVTSKSRSGYAPPENAINQRFDAQVPIASNREMHQHRKRRYGMAKNITKTPLHSDMAKAITGP